MEPTSRARTRSSSPGQGRFSRNDLEQIAVADFDVDGLADVLGVVGAVDLDADGDPDLAWIDAVVDGTLAGGDGELRWMENRHKTFGAVGRADRAG